MELTLKNESLLGTATGTTNVSLKDAADYVSENDQGGKDFDQYWENIIKENISFFEDILCWEPSSPGSTDGSVAIKKGRDWEEVFDLEE